MGILVGILLLVVVGANVYGTKDEAINQIQNHKLSASKVINQIGYISNRVCPVDYDTEKVKYCEVCFIIELTTKDITQCVRVSETATRKDIDSAVRTHAREYVDDLYKSEDYSFENLNIKGDIITP